jgi:formylglycine-generating enzyme
MKRSRMISVAVAGLGAISGCSSSSNGSGPSDGGSIDAASSPSNDASGKGAGDDSLVTEDAGTDGSEGTGDGGAAAMSCQKGGPGLTNCGFGGNGTESCCTSLEVPGGTYFRTYDNPNGNLTTEPGGIPVVAADGGPTSEADPATVSDFQLDKYLVTVGRFRQFVTAWTGGWKPAPGSGKHTHLNGGQGLTNSASPASYETGWVGSGDGQIAPTDANLVASCDVPNTATWTTSPSTQENLPINCVNWWESYAFCIWDGGFLPSEAEWEYAAAGGSQQREYPWGSTDPGASNQYAIYDCDYPSGSGTCESVANIAPVGTPTSGAGLWGQLDLAGDVWEWNLDWLTTYVDPCADCAYLTPTTNRERRGGDNNIKAVQLLPASRSGCCTPPDRSAYNGFRCARSP